MNGNQFSEDRINTNSDVYAVYGYYISSIKNIDANTGDLKKPSTNYFQIRLIFFNAKHNFSKKYRCLPLTLCMTGEL